MLGRFLAVFAGLLLVASASGAGAAQAVKIGSVTFSAPAPLKAGDIITVDLAGTPGVRAAFSVRGLIATTQMKELSAGSYHAAVTVPAGKTVRNAPLVGYLGTSSAHADPVQASRLVTVVAAQDNQPAKLPAVEPEKHPKPMEPPALSTPKPTPPPQPVVAPTPPPAVDTTKIELTSPANGATLRNAITVKGLARANSTVKVLITYNNNLSGVLKLGGEVTSQNVAAGKNGEFRMGPIALDGPLATDGLRFTIKAYYPDRVDHETAEVTVIGKRE